MSIQALEPKPPQIPNLEPVSWLIADHKRRDQFLSGLDAKKREIAQTILRSATRLEQGTGWDGDTLVRWLGCPANTVVEFGKLQSERLQISAKYLSFLDELTALIEVQFDKRMLVLGYGRLYLRAAESTEALKAAFNQAQGNRLTAKQYLELGEVQAALDAAMDEIEPDHDKPITTPFDHLPEVHISTPRLDALIKGEGEFDSHSPAPNVIATRIHGHIRECAACQDAYEYREQEIQSRSVFVEPD
jgi:hypothetical protein